MKAVRERWRGRIAILAALMVHASVHLALRHQRVVEKAPPDPSLSTAVPDVEIELRPTAQESPAGSEVAMVVTPARLASARTAHVEPSRTMRGTTEAETSASGTGIGVSDGPAPVGSNWSFQPTMPNLHPNSVELLATNGDRAAAETRPTVSRTGGLVESLDEADVERGLGRGGPVRTAIELVTRQENAPVRGSATFSVTIFSDGKIDVQVASNQTDWSHLIPAIREAVRKAQVRMPPKSRGLNVVVAVDAKVRYPDGYEPPAEQATLNTQLALDRDKPLVDIDARSERCWARGQIVAGAVAFAADCAVGTAARSVATRLVSERRL